MFGDLFKARPKKAKVTKVQLAIVMQDLCDSIFKEAYFKEGRFSQHYCDYDFTEDEANVVREFFMKYFDAVFVFVLYSKKLNDVVGIYKERRSEKLAQEMASARVSEHMNGIERICSVLKSGVVNNHSVPMISAEIVLNGADIENPMDFLHKYPGLQTAVASSLSATLTVSREEMELFEVTT